ncbi:Ig-like domain (group 2), partial [Butyrivibrio sp. ob235]|uniref:Ig-like domain-containing protein n=1 Tax=Butyrivibrio sp. ob235 TaxID=1761780 RepID=UPI0008D7AE6C
PEAVKLTTTALTIEVGKSAKVKASVKMESGKEIALGDAHCAKLRYKTTNEKIATVDKNGNVTGVAAGTCEVYVYSKNGLAKKCTVTVK